MSSPSFISTLRPGLLVSLKTSISGGVSYAKTTIESDHEVESGARVARWETERTITDPAEHEKATKVRSKVRSIIAGVCAHSAFGLLCPENKVSELEAAIGEARALAEAFNGTAQLSKVHVYVIAGKIAPDDVEAVRAIRSEISDLMGEMKDGIKELDPTKVRNAAKRARSVGQMLAPAAQERVKGAIDLARSMATKIVKAGETAAVEIDAQTMRALETARTAFLDIEGVAPVVHETTVAAPAIDFAPGESEGESDGDGASKAASDAQPVFSAAPPVLDL